MDKAKNLIYNKENSQERLDKFLHIHYPGFSRTQLQKAIKNGFVVVNGKKVAPHHFLKKSDHITIKQLPQKITVDLPKVTIDIIKETDDYIIINKPPYIPVHPDATYRRNTLIQQITERYPDITKWDQESERPGIVHRLDKDVSGVMVIARTQKMFSHLKDQFRKKRIYKEYIALVHEPLKKNEGHISFNIGRSKTTGKMTARPPAQTGRGALTYYEVIKNFEHFALLKIIIKTGRTHQIRSHLLAFGHPVAGDTLYAAKKKKARVDLDRPFLHARTLGFFDTRNRWKLFHSPTPQKLLNILDQLA